MEKLTLVTHNTNGNEIKCTFEESKSNSGYGRDIYIGINIYVDNEWKSDYLMDCRYIINYDFKKICYSYVERNWNGEIVEE